MQPMIVRCSPRERCVRIPTDFDALSDVVDLCVGDVGSGNDDHGETRESGKRRGQQKKRPVRFTGRGVGAAFG